MKQFSRQPRTHSIVPPGIEETQSRVAEPSQETRSSLEDFFDGWLSSVSPAMLQSTTETHKPARALRAQTSLTSTDLIRVNRATVRESLAHRHWPQEVIQTFLAADVIRRKR